VSARRFEALDSWRGLCAVLVVLHHFQSTSHTYELAIVRNAYLFVDFFFVLSGFVMAANYGARLREGFGVGRFMLLRFGRVYPLHVFVLAWFVAFELAQLLLPIGQGLGGGEPFAAPQQSPDTILANLALVHSLDLYDFLTWNAPSWSISTEFYTYLAFAVAVIVFGRRTWIPIALAGIGGPIVLALFSDTGMNATYRLGFVRCLYGFAVGALCYGIWRRLEGRLGPLGRSGWIATGAEVAVVAGLLWLVHGSEERSLAILSPYAFGLTIVVFCSEAGGLSRLLLTRPLLWCGALSYSLYMTHFFIQQRLMNGVQLLESRTDARWLTRVEREGSTSLLLGTEPWQGDLALVGMLVLVFAVSHLTYHRVEVPARRWFRRLADRLAMRPESGDGGLQRESVTGG
jgi:peptidoglycan/LPS O-acetylase OafA/YrhL